jgi:hypothetical protein
MVASNLSPFPPGNPFHYDPISTGARLKDIVSIDEKFPQQAKYADLYIMFSSENLGNGLYLYNKKTGQRLKITVE